MSSTTRRSNVRRSNVTACARCKSRKQRCDQNIPACSNCERAGVECVGHDADGSVLPRRYPYLPLLILQALLMPKAISRVSKTMLRGLSKSWQGIAQQIMVVHGWSRRCLGRESMQHWLKPVSSHYTPQLFPVHVTWEVPRGYHYFAFSLWVLVLHRWRRLCTLMMLQRRPLPLYCSKKAPYRFQGETCPIGSLKHTWNTATSFHPCSIGRISYACSTMPTSRRPSWTGLKPF